MRSIKRWAFCVLLCVAPAAHAASIRTGGEPAGNYGWVYVSDVIDAGDAQKLDAALKQVAARGKKPIVVLASRGGDVDAAMAMGRLLRKSGAATYHEYCASSCVYAFLGGTLRFVNAHSEGASLTVHRPELADAYVHSPSAFAKAKLDTLRDYIVEMTGSAVFYDAMMKIPFQSPTPLSPENAVQMKVATNIAR